MTGISIEQSFLIAQRTAAREWRLLLPVVLAFLVFPPLAMDLLLPPSVRLELSAAMQSGDPTPMMGVASWFVPLSFLLFLFGLAGGLVITALAIVPRISVREAIVLGLRRLPILCGILLMMFAAMMVIAFVATYVLLLFRLDFRAVQSLLLGVLTGLIIYAGVRLSVMNAVVIARSGTPLAVLRDSLAMTRGLFWPLLSSLAIYIVVGTIVMLAVGTALGAVFMLAGAALSVPDLALALNAIVTRSLAGAVGLGLHLLGAAFFLQLRGSSKGI
jgi:hypothetical protein